MASPQQISSWEVWVRIMMLSPSTDSQDSIELRVQSLIEGMSSYLNTIQLKDFRTQFFVCRLRCYMNQKDLVALASKVELCFRRLRFIIGDLKEELSPFALFPQEVNPEFQTAIKQGDRQTLLWFSETLHFLEQGQVLALFHWALEKWDVEILCNMLTRWKQIPLDVLIDKALELNRLSDVVDLIILHHFNTLSKKSLRLIKIWMRFQEAEIAAALNPLKALLQTVLKKDEEGCDFNGIKALFDEFGNKFILGRGVQNCWEGCLQLFEQGATNEDCIEQINATINALEEFQKTPPQPVAI